MKAFHYLLIFMALFFCRDTLSGQNTPVFFGGMPHTAKGQAILEISGDTALVLSNIGSSGNDGADVGLGEGKGFGFSLHEPDPFTLPVGAFKQWTMIGSLAGQPNQTIWAETHEVVLFKGQPGVQVSFNSSPMGATQNYIRVFDENGTAVLEKVFPVGPLYTRIGYCCGPEPVRWDKTCVVLPGIPPKMIHFGFPDGTEATLPVSRIETGPANPKYFPNFCTTVQSRHSSVGFSLLQTEYLTVFEERFPHRALGNAHFAGANQGNRLLLTNMGSSGDDGVEILLKNAPSFRLGLASVVPGGGVNSLIFGATGKLGATADAPLGFVRHESTATPNTYKVTPDFSALGSPSILYQVLRGGQLIFSLQGGATPEKVTVGALPVAIGKLEGIGGGLSCYAEQFSGLQSFNFNGNIVQGNELRMLVQLPAPVPGLTTFFLKFSGIQQAVIGSEVVPSKVDIVLNAPQGEVFWAPTDTLNFSWTTTGGYSGDYYLGILELNLNDTIPAVFPDSADLFFYRSGISGTNFQYIPGLPPFQYGKKYAWIVGAVGGGIRASAIQYIPISKNPCKLAVNGVPTSPLCPGDCFTISGPVIAVASNNAHSIIAYSDHPSLVDVNGLPAYAANLLDNVTLETPVHYTGSGATYTLNICIKGGSSTPVKIWLYFYRPPSSTDCAATPLKAPCCFDTVAFTVNVANVPNYGSLNLAIQHPISHANLTDICSGDPILVCLTDAAGNVPPAGSPVAPVITWECSTNAGPFTPVPYTNFSATQFCFNVPVNVVTASNCGSPSPGYEDKVFRATLTVTDPMTGKVCTYYSSTYPLRICCPVPKPTVVLSVQPPSALNGTLCEGDVVTINVSLTGLPAWFPPGAGSVVTVDWCLNNVPIPLPPGTTQFSYPVTVGKNDLCFSVKIKNCGCPLVTAETCIPVDPAPQCGTIIGCHPNLTLVASTPMLCYEICPGKEATVCIDQPFTNCTPHWEFSFDNATWKPLGQSNPMQNTNILPCDEAGSPYEWPVGQQCIYYRISCYPLNHPMPSGCEPCTSNTIKVCLKPSPNTPSVAINGPNPICKGSTSIINVQSPQTGIIYTWYCNGLVVGSGTSYPATQEAWYWVTADNGCEIKESNHVFLKVCMVTAGMSCPLWPNACAKFGEEIHLSGCSSKCTCPGPLTYSWTYSSGTLGTTSQATNLCDLYAFPDMTGTTYTLTVTWTDGTITCTDQASITIVPCK